jgi:putative ABC transport system permease protein
MKWNTLVLRELLQRKRRLIASSLAIILGITAIVAINSIMIYSQKAVAKELDALGANILILPKTATLGDYYSADLQSGELPEEYVTLLTTSNLEGLDNLSPKLSVPIKIQNNPIILTGILPKNEFENKASWQGAGVFSRPKSCGNVTDIFGLTKKSPKETLVRKRVIETLGSNEILVGSDIAKKLKISQGENIEILKNSFKVSAILPPTGTIDDSRIFAHLHTVQSLTGKDGVVNAIEVVCCCEQISKGLVGKIDRLIPDAKVVTISQIVDTQIKTNHLMQHLSTLFVVIIIVIGGVSIANDMYNNVHERRKEIGTLVALGANSAKILKIFLLKALMLGGMGGIGGYILGTLFAIILGPLIAGIPTLPVPSLLGWSLLLAISIAILASYFPARYATRLDPCAVIQEI